jgi:hypothetical protein
MSYVYYNPNPKQLQVGDCTIRALSKALDSTWRNTFMMLCDKALDMCDMPSSNRVWGAVLLDHGFHRYEQLPECTVESFCRMHPRGTFILGTGVHVIAVIDGDYYDMYDSGSQVIYYYWSRYE